MPIDDAIVEVRGGLPREVVEVIDAVAIAERADRMQIIRRVMAEWANAKVHEASLIMRVRNGNGSYPEGTPTCRNLGTRS